MERALQLHGVVRPADDAERARPRTGSSFQDKSGLSADLVAALLSRLADLHEHYAAIADGKRDAGDTLGGKLLDEVDTALSAMTSACAQPTHSKVADAAARVQGEARNASLAISTALAMGASGDSDEVLKLELEKMRGELLAARMEGEAAKAKSATQVAELQQKLSDKEAEMKMLQGATKVVEEDESAVAKDLMSAAKTTALEAENVELNNEVKQLKAQLEKAAADAKAVRAAAAAAVPHDASQRPPTASAAVASR